MIKSMRKQHENKARNRRETFKVKHLTEVRQKYLLSVSLLLLFLLLLFSEPRLESHSSMSLSIPVTPGNSSLIWSHVTLGSRRGGGGGGGEEVKVKKKSSERQGGVRRARVSKEVGRKCCM